MKSNNKSLSDRIYHASMQDGSIDLFAGIAVTTIGFGWLIGLVALAAVVPALLVPVYLPFRKRFIEPRIGHVEFGEERQSQLRLAHVVLILIGVLIFLLGIAGFFFFERDPNTGNLLRAVVPGLPAILLGIGGVISAYMFSIHRLAIYGLILLLAGGAGAYFAAHPGWPMLIGGLVTLVAGALILFRFMTHFPRLESEVK